MSRSGRFGRYLFLLLLGLFFFAGQNRAFVMAAGSGSDSVVLAVDVTGNEHISTETVLKAITHVRLGEEWNADSINKDIEAIRELGYFSSVDASGEPFLGGLKLLFHVKENPLFRELKIEGLKKVKPESLLPFFSQKKGEVVNTGRLMADLGTAVRNCSDEQGYGLILKNSQIAADGVVTLTLAELKVRKIAVTGLERTKDIVVLRELSVKEGDILNLNDLRDDMQKLYRLGFLENVNPSIQNTGDPEWVDLVIEVSEVQKNNQFYVGIGYAPKTNKISGDVQISTPNLWGLGRSASVVLNMARDERNFFLSYADPWFLPNHVSLRTQLYYNNLIDQNYIDEYGNLRDDLYNETNMGFDLMVGWPLGKNFTLNSALDFKHVNMKNWADGNDLSGDGDPIYWNNSIGFSLVNNNLLYQRKKSIVTGGNWNSLTATFYTDLLGGDWNYSSYIAETHQFVTPWGNGPTFALRIKAGTMVGTSPRTEQFEIGGPTTVRGYDDNIDSGTNLLLVNGEVRFYPQAFENLGFVLFYDYGRVKNDWHTGDYSSYGVGVRLNIPMLGPIRLDYGWNQQGDPKLSFFFGEMF